MSAPVSTSAPAVPSTPGARPRLLLLDGHSLAYRAFFALPVENFSTTTGQPTNAVYGFTSMLINILRDEQPTHLAVAFDVARRRSAARSTPSTRPTARDARPTSGARSAWSRRCSTRCASRSSSRRGFEADDVIATLAGQARRAGHGGAHLHRRPRRLPAGQRRRHGALPAQGVSELTRMTPAAVEEKYGLRPTQYPDFAALGGDPSDNLPGIPASGQKTAAKWIREYGVAGRRRRPGRRDQGQGRRDAARAPGVGDAQPPAQPSWSATVPLPVGPEDLRCRRGTARRCTSSSTACSSACCATGSSPPSPARSPRSRAASRSTVDVLARPASSATGWTRTPGRPRPA